MAPTVLCMSSDLIFGYITGIHFCVWTKEMLCNALYVIYHNPSKVYEYHIVYYIYADNLTI